jgi:aminoglycoside phosphotransferase (APT) family kinase protein
MERDRELAAAIVSALGMKFVSVDEIVGQGEVNRVFVVRAAVDKWVLRFAIDPLDADHYEKEEWCLKTMSASAVPAPRFVARGVFENVPYIVQEFVDGRNGDERRTPRLWEQLGRYARLINETPLDSSAPDDLFPRFGRDLQGNWHAHIAYNLGQLRGGDPLIEVGAYPASARDALWAAFESLEAKIDRFGLTHGDSVPKNVLCRPDGEVVLLDWGSAGTGAVPHHDFNRLWLDEAGEGFTPQDLESFAVGYGVRVSDLRETLRGLRILGAVDLVRWAIDQRPDRIEHYAKRCAKVVEAWLGSSE